MNPSSCPSESRLREFLRGTCDEAELEMISEHLARCRRCERQAEQFEANPGTLAAEVLNVTLVRASAQEYIPLLESPSGRKRGSRIEGGSKGLRSAAHGQEGPAEAEAIRSTIGPLHIVSALEDAGFEEVSLLGRGSMGVVFKARQAVLDRPVAIKVIDKAGGPSNADLRRFRSEAEFVASMDHPNIVPIYEIGTSLGHEYFSMKLIPGKSLDRKLADYIEDPRGAAALVETAAEAVHHAHVRGVLHRDIKPANILVDEAGRPHVTDFGIAYRLDGQGDFTRAGMLLGTPCFMAPEQATGEKDALTTSSDVYSLGAVLYALLTGRPPLIGSGLFETINLVRSTPPEPPSRRNKRVARDLEIICLKCLEKDPANRYPDARSLAQDLHRWLSGRPIDARPVGLARRCLLWSRRHPVPAGLSAALLASIVGGAGLVTWKWREAARKETKSEMVVTYLADRILREGSTDLNPWSTNPSLREVLDRAASRVGGDFHDEPEVEAAIRETLGSTYASLGEIARAEPHLREALKLDTTLLGPSHPTTLHVANELAALLAAKKEPAEAEKLLRATREAARAALGPDSPTALDVDDHLGSLLRREGRCDEAEPLLRATLAARRRILPTDDPKTLRSVRELCLLAVDRRKFAEAEALAFEYEHGIRCAFGPKHPDNVAALSNRGLIRRLRGRVAEAEPFYRQAAEEADRILGPDHHLTQLARDEHARVAAAAAEHAGDRAGGKP